MRPPQPIALPSDHRLARLTTWLVLWLTWLARILHTIAPGFTEAAIAEARRRVRTLIIVRALKQVAPPDPRARSAPRDPRVTRRLGRLRLRAIAGGCLRRALRGRGPIAAVAALRAALDRIDVWVGRVARRLRRGFRHLRRIHFAPPSIPSLAAPCPAPPAADTS